MDKGPSASGVRRDDDGINRHDFGVSWNARLDRGGFVVGDDVDITLDAEAIREGAG